MTLTTLSDGTAVSSPVYNGFPPIPHLCSAEHAWQVAGPRDVIPEHAGDEFKFIQMEKCSKCGYFRSHLYKE